MSVAVLLALALQQAVEPPPVAPPPVPAPRPASRRRAIDWAMMPPLPYREAPSITDPMKAFVTGEVSAGRCRANLRGPARLGMQVDIAVLVTPEDGARVTIPRAIDCPTVEQYAAGLVLAFARNNLSQRATLAPQWYRATLTFEWPG